MKNSQRGSISLMALLFSSFLLSLGGMGAAASYFQKKPDDFLAQLHTYFNSSVNAEEPTPSVTPTPTPEETPTAGATPTPGGKPSISGIGGSDEEEIHESDTAKIHEHGQNNGNAGDTESETEIED